MRTLRAGLRTTSLLLVCAAMVVGLLGSTPASAAGRAATTERVNVRSGPATTYRVLGQLSQGQTVTTNGTSKGWTKVTYRSRTGYVASRYLEAAGAPAAAAVTTGFAAGTVRLATTGLNVRRGAATDGTAAAEGAGCAGCAGETGLLDRAAAGGERERHTADRRGEEPPAHHENGMGPES